MKAKLILSLSLAVATLVATVWFLEGPQGTKQASIASNTIAPKPEQAEPTQQQSADSKQQFKPFNDTLDKTNDTVEESAVTQTVSREQAIDDLQSKFRLLENQYGVLSIDDIQAIEESLSNIGEVNNVTDFSNALDDLIYQQ